MKSKTKVNKKRLLFSIIVLIIIIVAIILIVKNIGKKDSNITLDGTSQKIDGVSVSNSQEIEYDGNPYSVPQEYTVAVDEYVYTDGEAIDDSSLNEIKQSMIEKFKQSSTDNLQLDADMQNIRIIFNQGTTTIADSTCLVFVVYEEKDDSLNFKSKYAMSLDTKVIYKYDSESLVYNMLEI
jgi:hypothetical protein